MTTSYLLLKCFIKDVFYLGSILDYSVTRWFIHHCSCIIVIFFILPTEARIYNTVIIHEHFRTCLTSPSFSILLMFSITANFFFRNATRKREISSWQALLGLKNEAGFQNSSFSFSFFIVQSVLFFLRVEILHFASCAPS